MNKVIIYFHRTLSTVIKYTQIKQSKNCESSGSTAYKSPHWPTTNFKGSMRAKGKSKLTNEHNLGYIKMNPSSLYSIATEVMHRVQL